MLMIRVGPLRNVSRLTYWASSFLWTSATWKRVAIITTLVVLVVSGQGSEHMLGRGIVGWQMFVK